MVQQQPPPIERDPFLGIRTLAALDLALHGPRWILAEFATAVLLCGGLGLLGLRVFVRQPGHPLVAAVLGVFPVGIALNYAVLLLYAVGLVRHRIEPPDVEPDGAHRDADARRYTLRSAVLVLPLVVPALAIRQEVAWRARRQR